MSRLYSKRKKPTIPLPKWAAEPTRTDALEKVENHYLEHFIDLRLKELNLTRKAMMNMPQEVRVQIIREATNTSLQALAETSELQDRASTHLALKVLRTQGQTYDKDPKGERLEDESFPSFLMRRWGELKSPGAISEVEFMLNLCVMFESRGKGAQIEEMFQNRQYFSKFCRAIPFLRLRNNSLYAAEKHIEETIQQYEAASVKLLKAINEETDPEVRATLSAQRDTLKGEASKLKEKKAEVVADFEGKLQEGLRNAVIMSRLKEVHANDRKDDPLGRGISQLLFQGVTVREVTEEDPETGDMKVVPNTWELVYPETPKTIMGNPIIGKFTATKMFVNSHVAIVIEVPTSSSRLVEETLSSIADVKTVDPLYGIADLIESAEMGESIWGLYADKFAARVT